MRSCISRRQGLLSAMTAPPGSAEWFIQFFKDSSSVKSLFLSVSFSPYLPGNVCHCNRQLIHSGCFRRTSAFHFCSSPAGFHLWIRMPHTSIPTGHIHRMITVIRHDFLLLPYNTPAFTTRDACVLPYHCMKRILFGAYQRLLRHIFQHSSWYTSFFCTFAVNSCRIHKRNHIFF